MRGQKTTGYEPVVIIGAPRSGTNMLRDILTSFEGVATWPCDEINYIWRHGNVRHPSDEFPPELAHPRVQQYIRRQFDWVARHYSARMVIEKTCANSLRVPFVDAVVPDARYLFIHRDGLDVVGSAVSRWKAPLDIPYLARKARFVPAADLPYYGGRYVWNRLYRVLSRRERLAFWGPQLDNMQELLANHPLDEVCAVQWQRCVELALAAFLEMDPSRWLAVSYETMVTTPERELERILDFLGLAFSREARREAVREVSATSVGKGRKALGDSEVRRLGSLVGDTLDRFGYAI